MIPGMRTVKHVEMNTGISDGVKLSEELLSKLKEHSWERNFYSDHDPWLKDSNFVEA